MIVIYVYDKTSGLLLYKATGVADFLMYDIKDSEDFTLAPYPLDGNRYKWDGLEWVKADSE